MLLVVRNVYILYIGQGTLERKVLLSPLFPYVPKSYFLKDLKRCYELELLSQHILQERPMKFFYHIRIFLEKSRSVLKYSHFSSHGDWQKETADDHSEVELSRP